MTPQQKDLILGALLKARHTIAITWVSYHEAKHCDDAIEKLDAAIKELEAMPTTTKEVKND